MSKIIELKNVNKWFDKFQALKDVSFSAPAGSVVSFIGWWAVLFTGSFPKSMFDLIVQFLRWSQRVSVYMANMSDEYPPFSGLPDEHK